MRRVFRVEYNRTNRIDKRCQVLISSDIKGASFTQGTVSSILIVGSISPEGFLPPILLLVVIIVTVVIVAVILVVVVVAIVGVVIGVAQIGVVDVVDGCIFLIKNFCL
ncbi:hypothetical protein Tco_1562408 [Tanacetum coccineum]